MNSDTPKQYLEVQGKTILEHTIGRFYSLSRIAGILIVVSESDPYIGQLKDHLFEMAEREGVPLCIALGGNERSETVTKGLAYLSEERHLPASQWVMVHDAARPCVRKSDLLNLLEANDKVNGAGVILASPVRDTLKLACKNNTIITTHSRESLWQAQTPQLFMLGVLRDALNKADLSGIQITDEASAMEYCGKEVQLLEGSSDNIKLTTPSDFAIIEFLLKDTER